MSNLSTFWQRLTIAAIAALIAGLLGLGGWQARDAALVATVDYARSGHTLELLSELSAAVPVMQIRLAGVQAPDPQQAPWGEAARQGLADLARGVVRVEPQQPEPDQYDRLWAYVWSGQQLVNAALLAQGWVFLDSDRLPQQRYGDELLYAQEAARLQGLGIWDPANPLRQTPAAFREAPVSP